VLVEKNWVCSMGRFGYIEATTSVIFFCSSCIGKLAKIDIFERNFEIVNAIFAV